MGDGWSLGGHLGKLSGYFLNGLFAGLAAATKLYGGYIVLAGLGAIGFSPSRRLWKIGWLLLGLLSGIALGFPYLWVDPQGWWDQVVLETIDEFLIRSPSFDKGRISAYQQGIVYLFGALNRRFFLPWILLAVLGFGYLIQRREKSDLFFFIPLGGALCLLGLALAYLREWDLVNFTPYLALVIGVFGVGVLGFNKGVGYRRLTSLAFSLFLIWQGWVALSDARLARFPDTRQLARHWVLRHVDPGERLFLDTPITGANWVPTQIGLALIGMPYKEMISPPILRSARAGDTAVVERAWWDPPLEAAPLSRVQTIDLRNTYFENPRITFFRYGFELGPPGVVLPHVRVLPPEPAFLTGEKGSGPPMDLVADTPLLRERYLMAPGSLREPLFYVNLGQGKGGVGFGPALWFPVKGEITALSCGTFRPIRRLLPGFPRTYLVSITPHSAEQGFWVGLYPDPTAAFPLLARFQQWDRLEKLGDRYCAQGEAPLEASLFYAAALSALGRSKEAASIVADVGQKDPAFFQGYRRLTEAGGETLFLLLRKMVKTSRVELAQEDVFWPERPGEMGEVDRYPRKVAVLSEDRLFHLWLPHSFLPGFLTAAVQVKVKDTGRLRVISVAANTVVEELRRVDVKPGQERIVLPLEVRKGPTRLEFRLETQNPVRPEIIALHVSPDFSSEFAWRWGLFNQYLGRWLKQ